MLNVRSMRNGLEYVEMELVNAGGHFDITCLSEIWIKEQ